MFGPADQKKTLSKLADTALLVVGGACLLCVLPAGAKAQDGTASQIVADRFDPIAHPFAVTGAPTSGYRGLAAGDEKQGWSVWTSAAASWFEKDYAPAKTDSTSQIVSFGADRKIYDRLTVGLSLSYIRTEADTIYNGGETTSNGVSVLPYVAWRLNDWLSLDASAGYSFTKTDQDRDSLGVTVTGNYLSHAVTGALNLNAAKWYGPVMTSAKLGLFASASKRTAFTESDGTVNRDNVDTLLQAKAGVTVGYLMRPLMPYLSATYVYDLNALSPTVAGEPDDRDELRLKLGTHILGKGKWQNISGGLSVSHHVGREKRHYSAASLNLRIRF